MAAVCISGDFLAREQALLFGRAKLVSRERASEWRSREGQRAEGPSLARSREARPNRRAYSQARDFCESTARDDCICQYWFPKVVLLKFMYLPDDSLLVYPCDQILEPLTDAIPRPC